MTDFWWFRPAWARCADLDAGHVEPIEFQESHSRVGSRILSCSVISRTVHAALHRRDHRVGVRADR